MHFVQQALEEIRHLIKVDEEREMQDMYKKFKKAIKKQIRTELLIDIKNRMSELILSEFNTRNSILKEYVNSLDIILRDENDWRIEMNKHIKALALKSVDFNKNKIKIYDRCPFIKHSDCPFHNQSWVDKDILNKYHKCMSLINTSTYDQFLFDTLPHDNSDSVHKFQDETIGSSIFPLSYFNSEVNMIKQLKEKYNRKEVVLPILYKK